MGRRSASLENVPTRPRWRAFAFRGLAVLVGLAPLATAEVAFRIADVGRPSLDDDPFVGFSAVRPLFVPNEAGDRYAISPAFAKFFRPDSFAARKPPGEFRAFVLGGSTVQGRPFAIETAFATWLELSLRAADPSHPWEVVNCGGISYASYRLVPILREVLAYQPDLIVLCTGQNEFLEDRTYGHLKRLPRPIRRPLEFVANLRTFGLARRAALGLAGWSDHAPEGRPILGPEVQALLDYKGGLEAYHRDETWRQDVIDHFAFNVRRMVRIAREAGVPIILVNEVANLDMPPFKSEHRADLTDPELRRFESCWDEARSTYETSLPRSIQTLERAIAIDDQHAGIHYTLAKCLQDLGRSDEAKAEFLLAKELDVCPLRILQPMVEAVRAIGRETGTPVIDLTEFFEARSPGGIPDGDWMVDHVHPSIAGHQLIGDALADELVTMGLLAPEPGWKGRRDRAFEEQMASLDAFYYLKGQQRLGNLQLWAQGRADRLRPPASKSESETSTRSSPALDVAPGN